MKICPACRENLSLVFSPGRLRGNRTRKANSPVRTGFVIGKVTGEQDEKAEFPRKDWFCHREGYGGTGRESRIPPYGLALPSGRLRGNRTRKANSPVRTGFAIGKVTGEQDKKDEFPRNLLYTDRYGRRDQHTSPFGVLQF